MEVLRGANLVGMSVLPLDACPSSWLIQKIHMLPSSDCYNPFVGVTSIELMFSITFSFYDV